MIKETEYTLSEAAIRLSELVGRSEIFSRQYIHKLCKQGKLEHRKIGLSGSIIVTTESALHLYISNERKSVGRPKKNS